MPGQGRALWGVGVSEDLKCHMCGNPTEFTCQDCGEPVCEDCCVVPTYMNQIDYTLCQSCQDGHEAADWLERDREHKRQDARNALKATRNAAAKKRYWKPENVEKRRQARVERTRTRVERNRRMFSETMKIVGEMFR